MGNPTVCWKILLPRTTNMLSMRNPNISLMSTSVYLCVESESWITHYLREWLTTKYEYFLLPFLSKKQLSIRPKNFLFNMSWSMVVKKCCEIKGFDSVNFRKKMVILSFLVVECLNIYIWLTPPLAYTVVQYIWSLFFTAVNSFIRCIGRCFVEHFFGTSNEKIKFINLPFAFIQ
jgi:hypothetical protein